MWCEITLKQILGLNSHRIFFFFMGVQLPLLVIISWIQIGKQQLKLYRLGFEDHGVLLCSSLAAANECHPAWCIACLLTQPRNSAAFTHIQLVRKQKKTSEKMLIILDIFKNKERNKTNHLYSWPNPHSCSSEVGGLSQEGCFFIFKRY